MAIDSHELPESELLEPGGDQGDALVPGRKRRLVVNGRVWTNVLIGVLLVAILAAGAYFRFTGQNWDDYTHLHPDERHMSGVTDQLGQPRLEPTGSDASQAVQRQLCLERYPDTQGVATTIFDSMCSTWYPLNIGKAYFYGELPLYVVKVASWLTTAVSGNTEWMHYNQVQLVGRSVSAIADLITLVFLFLIGRRLYNAWIGLLAAGLYAAAVFPIQLSHYWTTDAFTNLPVVIAFWFAVRAMLGPNRGTPSVRQINKSLFVAAVGLLIVLMLVGVLTGLLPDVLLGLLVGAICVLLVGFVWSYREWLNYVGFGVAMGAALASKINTAPLFGIIVLAAMVYALPALDITLPRSERWRLVWYAVGGCIIAGLVTFITFRITNPHAFTGGPGVLGFFNIIPYGPWLDALRQSQSFASGAVDFPPNNQWASRPSYLFPWRNMVLWGMGTPLGLMSWLGWLWAGVQVLRARPLWTRHVLPVTWILVYFGYMGRQWVMTMRYYINLYPFLILMAAWALYEIVTRAWAWLRAHPTAARRLALAGSTLLLVVVVAGTYLWATMFVRIYQRQLTRVEATRWVQRNLPAGFSTVVTGSDGKTRLLNLFVPSTASIDVTAYQPLQHQVAELPQLQPFSFDRVTVGHLSSVGPDTQPRQFSVVIAADPNGAQVLAQGAVQVDSRAGNDSLGGTYTIVLDRSVTVGLGQLDYLISWSDGAVTIAHTNGDEADFVLFDSQSGHSTRVSLPRKNQDTNGISTLGDTPSQIRFSAPIAGTIDHFDIRHLLNPLKDGSQVELHVRVLDDQAQTALAEGVLKVDPGSTTTSLLGDPYTIKLDKALPVNPSRSLILEVTSSTPVQVTGTVIAWEGDWDDPVPWAVCPLPADMELTHDTPSGVNPPNCQAYGGLGTWYREAKLQMTLEDGDMKRETIQSALDQADYFVITSNRNYDSLTRMPMRFPMTINFYNALFAGQLGLKVDKLFTSYPSIGSFEVADEYLPIYSAPKWLNEWESEEAFTVYDHPAVFLFKKTAQYTPEALTSVLTRVPTTDVNNAIIDPNAPPNATLINRITWTPTESSAAPTAFQLTDDQRVIQTEGGTWSDLFNRDWAINTSPLLAVGAWWLVILLLGFAVWPILFTLLPGLPDRGYPFTKIVGLLIVSWLVWAGGTLRLLTWTQAGIALTFVAVAVVGALVGYRNRAALLDYMRLNWRHLVIVELLTFILFVAFVFVRLGNPDLWAQSLGGEKPMNFAFFNAVLRSTIFPPYDPWYANGYLNYYYYGYVLVGTPVKFLGMMPSIAYNLIVPMLFAMTGMGAFSVAFNVVASRWFFPRNEGEDRPDAPAEARRRFALRLPAASPYLAGTLALLLCVVFGNLDTPRVFLTGVASAGGYSVNRSDSSDLYQWKLGTFIQQNGRQPTPEENLQLTAEALNPSLGDQVSYSLYNARRVLVSLGNGLGQVLSGGALPISPERWFWGPRSVVGELPNPSNEINEMPYFTFVFADLHAHMIAMPLTLLAIAWIVAEVLAAGRIRRPMLVAVAATVLGGLVVGSLQPTNTWDWFTYLLLALVGLTFAMFLRRLRFGRRSVLQWAAQVGLFFAVQTIAALPFTAYWATSYVSGNAIKSFTGNKTPIWAYFDIHGLFLFAVVSLLAWQTARLLRRLYVRDFIGRAWTLAVLLAVIGVTTLVALFLFIVPGQFWLFNSPIPLAIVLLPLLAWCGILFFVPDQSREMRVVYALTGLALAITFGVEVVVLGADIGRQNTFFKFYIQAWILFSLASGVALAWLIQASKSWSLSLRVSWLTFLAVLMCIAALFPIMATQGKIAVRMAPQAPHVLDGDAYMEYATYYEGPTAIPLRDDLNIIHWLQDNVKGSPVILEAYMSEYKLGARISINTGLPTILGWRFHESQQRTLDSLGNIIWQRAANISAMYDLTDIPTVWNMFRFYHVEYIVVSKMEQTIYDPSGLAKFDTMVQRGLLEVVYNRDYTSVVPGDKNEKTTTTVLNRIYHVVPGATLSDVAVGGQ